MLLNSTATLGAGREGKSPALEGDRAWLVVLRAGWKPPNHP